MIWSVNHQRVCSNITNSLSPESGIMSDLKKIFVLFTHINSSTKAILVSLIKNVIGIFSATCTLVAVSLLAATRLAISKVPFYYAVDSLCFTGGPWMHTSFLPSTPIQPLSLWMLHVLGNYLIHCLCRWLISCLNCFFLSGSLWIQRYHVQMLLHSKYLVTCLKHTTT